MMDNETALSVLRTDADHAIVRAQAAALRRAFVPPPPAALRASALYRSLPEARLHRGVADVVFAPPPGAGGNGDAVGADGGAAAPTANIFGRAPAGALPASRIRERLRVVPAARAESAPLVCGALRPASRQRPSAAAWFNDDGAAAAGGGGGGDSPTAVAAVAASVGTSYMMQQAVDVVAFRQRAAAEQLALASAREERWAAMRAVQTREAKSRVTESNKKRQARLARQLAGQQLREQHASEREALVAEERRGRTTGETAERRERQRYAFVLWRGACDIHYTAGTARVQLLESHARRTLAEDLLVELEAKVRHHHSRSYILHKGLILAVEKTARVALHKQVTARAQWKAVLDAELNHFFLCERRARQKHSDEETFGFLTIDSAKQELLQGVAREARRRHEQWLTELREFEGRQLHERRDLERVEADARAVTLRNDEAQARNALKNAMSAEKMAALDRTQRRLQETQRQWEAECRRQQEPTFDAEVSGREALEQQQRSLWLQLLALHEQEWDDIMVPVSLVTPPDYAPPTFRHSGAAVQMFPGVCFRRKPVTAFQHLTITSATLSVRTVAGMSVGDEIDAFAPEAGAGVGGAVGGATGNASPNTKGKGGDGSGGGAATRGGGGGGASVGSPGAGLKLVDGVLADDDGNVLCGIERDADAQAPPLEQLAGPEQVTSARTAAAEARAPSISLTFTHIDRDGLARLVDRACGSLVFRCDPFSNNLSTRTFEVQFLFSYSKAPGRGLPQRATANHVHSASISANPASPQTLPSTPLGRSVTGRSGFAGDATRAGSRAGSIAGRGVAATFVITRRFEVHVAAPLLVAVFEGPPQSRLSVASTVFDVRKRGEVPQKLFVPVVPCPVHCAEGNYAGATLRFRFSEGYVLGEEVLHFPNNDHFAVKRDELRGLDGVVLGKIYGKCLPVSNTSSREFSITFGDDKPFPHYMLEKLIQRFQYSCLAPSPNAQSRRLVEISIVTPDPTRPRTNAPPTAPSGTTGTPTTPAGSPATVVAPQAIPGVTTTAAATVQFPQQTSVLLVYITVIGTLEQNAVLLPSTEDTPVVLARDAAVCTSPPLRRFVPPVPTHLCPRAMVDAQGSLAIKDNVANGFVRASIVSGAFVWDSLLLSPPASTPTVAVGPPTGASGDQKVFWVASAFGSPFGSPGMDTATAPHPTSTSTSVPASPPPGTTSININLGAATPAIGKMKRFTHLEGRLRPGLQVDFTDGRVVAMQQVLRSLAIVTQVDEDHVGCTKVVLVEVLVPEAQRSGKNAPLLPQHVCRMYITVRVLASAVRSSVAVVGISRTEGDIPVPFGRGTISVDDLALDDVFDGGLLRAEWIEGGTGKERLSFTADPETLAALAAQSAATATAAAAAAAAASSANRDESERSPSHQGEADSELRSGEASASFDRNRRRSSSGSNTGGVGTSGAPSPRPGTAAAHSPHSLAPVPPVVGPTSLEASLTTPPRAHPAPQFTLDNASRDGTDQLILRQSVVIGTLRRTIDGGLLVSFSGRRRRDTAANGITRLADLKDAAPGRRGNGGTASSSSLGSVGAQQASTVLVRGRFVSTLLAGLSYLHDPTDNVLMKTLRLTLEDTHGRPHHCVVQVEVVPLHMPSVLSIPPPPVFFRHGNRALTRDACLPLFAGITIEDEDTEFVGDGVMSIEPYMGVTRDDVLCLLRQPPPRKGGEANDDRLELLPHPNDASRTTILHEGEEVAVVVSEPFTSGLLPGASVGGPSSPHHASGGSRGATPTASPRHSHHLHESSSLSTSQAIDLTITPRPAVVAGGTGGSSARRRSSVSDRRASASAPTTPTPASPTTKTNAPPAVATVVSGNRLRITIRPGVALGVCTAIMQRLAYTCQQRFPPRCHVRQFTFKFNAGDEDDVPDTKSVVSVAVNSPMMYTLPLFQTIVMKEGKERAPLFPHVLLGSSTSVSLAGDRLVFTALSPLLVQDVVSFFGGPDIKLVEMAEAPPVFAVPESAFSNEVASGGNADTTDTTTTASTAGPQTFVVCTVAAARKMLGAVAVPTEGFDGVLIGRLVTRSSQPGVAATMIELHFSESIVFTSAIVPMLATRFVYRNISIDPDVSERRVSLSWFHSGTQEEGVLRTRFTVEPSDDMTVVTVVKPMLNCFMREPCRVFAGCRVEDPDTPYFGEGATLTVDIRAGTVFDSVRCLEGPREDDSIVVDGPSVTHNGAVVATIVDASGVLGASQTSMSLSRSPQQASLLPIPSSAGDNRSSTNPHDHPSHDQQKLAITFSHCPLAVVGQLLRRVVFFSTVPSMERNRLVQATLKGGDRVQPTVASAQVTLFPRLLEWGTFSGPARTAAFVRSPAPTDAGLAPPGAVPGAPVPLFTDARLAPNASLVGCTVSVVPVSSWSEDSVDVGGGILGDARATRSVVGEFDRVVLSRLPDHLVIGKSGIGIKGGGAVASFAPITVGGVTGLSVVFPKVSKASTPSIMMDVLGGIAFESCPMRIAAPTGEPEKAATAAVGTGALAAKRLAALGKKASAAPAATGPRSPKSPTHQGPLVSGVDGAPTPPAMPLVPLSPAAGLVMCRVTVSLPVVNADTITTADYVYVNVV